MAAISAARVGGEVVIYERNDRCGRKLRITGKGRCNVTNDCNTQEFLANVPTNPRFLYSALDRFSTEDTKAFFEEEGVPLKVERGRRVFPTSDKATDVVDAMVKMCRERGVRSIKNDTHRDNQSMQRMQAKNGFEYCGIIYLKDGAERIAFEKVLEL
jgi:predicted Rossmann fold flavoprotein